MSIYLSLLVSIVGLLIWALAANPLVKEAGKYAYWCGLLAFLIRVSNDSFSILKG
jgi:hypothetical protein